MPETSSPSPREIPTDGPDEPLVPVPDDEALAALADFVERAGVSRLISQRRLENYDFIAGAMAVYFGLGWKMKLPGSWAFGWLGDRNPITERAKESPEGRHVLEMLAYQEKVAKRDEALKNAYCPVCDAPIRAIYVRDAKPDDEGEFTYRCPSCAGDAVYYDRRWRPATEDEKA